MTSDIADWLRQHNLEKYADAFVENEVSVVDLPHLTDDDFSDLGLPLGPRRRLQAALKTIGQPAEQYRGPLAETQTPDAAPGRQPGAGDAQRRQLTVMFVDLVGSTELSRRLDMEDLRQVNRAYQDAAVAAIQRYGGSVAKYMGDGVLAYFGYPEAHEDDAERAVRAGLELIQSVAALELPSIRDELKLSARVGIATGMVVVGELIGEGVAQEWSVVGETPNLAARVEAAASPGTVAVAPSTHRLTARLFEYHSLGPTTLKGFDEPIEIWRADGAIDVSSRFRATRGRFQTSLVGRDEELAMLLRRWERVHQDGEGHSVLLCGEPGIGKSRLAEAVRASAQATPHTWLAYQCSPHHVNSPFHPFIAQLSRASDIENASGASDRNARVTALIRGTPGTSDEDIDAIVTLLGIEDRLDPGLSPQARKNLIVGALVRQVRGLAKEQPLLCLLEDVHWADASTLEVLDQAMTGIDTEPVMLLATFRPEFDAPWIGQPETTLLTLGRMGARQSRRLAEEALRSSDIPQRLIDSIAARGDGVPLFIEELAQSALDDAATIVESDGAPKDSAIPESLLDTLTARLDRSPEAREAAQTASVIGRDFAFGFLEAVTVLDADACRNALNQLVDCGLVEIRGQLPDAVCRFKHALVRDAAYGSLLRDERIALHTKVAAELLRRDPSVGQSAPELLAHHYGNAGLAIEASKYLIHAGERCIEISAFSEAANHLKNALELLDRSEESADQSQLEIQAQELLGQVRHTLEGQGSKAVEECHLRVLELSTQLNDIARMFRSLLGLWRFYGGRGEWQKSNEYEDRAFRLAMASENPTLAAQSQMAHGTRLLHYGDLAGAKRALDEAIRAFQTYGPTELSAANTVDPEINALTRQSWVLWLLGEYERSKDMSAMSLSRAHERRHPYNICMATCFAAILASIANDFGYMRKCADEALAVAGQYGISQWESAAKLLASCAGILEADGSGADRLNAALQAYRNSANLLYEEYFLALSASALGKLGETDDAIRLADDAINLIDAERGVPLWLPTALSVRGVLDQSAGRLVNALEHYRRSIDVADRFGADFLALEAATLLASSVKDTGYTDAARDLAGRLERHHPPASLSS